MAKRDERGRFLVGTEPGPGRTSGYDPAMDDQAYKLALLGLTDEEMATFFGISHETFYEWRKIHYGFFEAINRGKEIADAEIAESLFRRARGMTVMSEKAFKGKDGEVVVAQTKTELPPDTRAGIHWLANRRRKSWTPPEPTPEDPHLPPGVTDASNLDDDDLAARIAELEARRKGEPQ